MPTRPCRSSCGTACPTRSCFTGRSARWCGSWRARRAAGSASTGIWWKRSPRRETFTPRSGSRSCGTNWRSAIPLSCSAATRPRTSRTGRRAKRCARSAPPIRACTTPMRIGWPGGCSAAIAGRRPAIAACRRDRLLLQLCINRGDVGLQARVLDVVALVLLGRLPARRHVVRALVGGHRGADVFQEIVVEPRVLVEIAPGHHRAVAGDDLIDVLDRGVRLAESRADFGAAAAVVVVEQRQVLAREDVAGVHHAQLREHDECVAVGVAAAEVVEVEAILAA